LTVTAVNALSISMSINVVALSSFHVLLAAALLPSSSWPDGSGIEAIGVAAPPCCSIYVSVQS
jgi:hypothetical protein